MNINHQRKAEMNIKPIAWSAFAMSAVLFANTAQADTWIFGNSGGAAQLIINGSTTITSSNTGNYASSGAHNSSNLNYLAGLCCDVNPPEFLRNDYFVFNLSGLTGSISSATLSIFNPAIGGFNSDTGTTSALFQTWDVSTSISTLEATQANATSIYSDLGSGILFGSATVGPSDNGSFINITLDNAALTALLGKEGSQFAVGGSLTWTDAVPEPSTWAMMMLGFCGLGFMAYRKRNRSHQRFRFV